MIVTSILVTLLILIDQSIKYIVINNLKLLESIPIIKGFFNITYVKNEGAAFNILENQQLFLILIGGLVIVSIAIYLKNNSKTIHLIRKIYISLILAGTIGNFIDRIIYQGVIDYLDFSFWGYQFAIFNFADTVLVIGTIIMIIEMLIGDKIERNQSSKPKRRRNKKSKN